MGEVIADQNKAFLHDVHGFGVFLHKRNAYAVRLAWGLDWKMALMLSRE